ncbi:hypothetical protein TNCV_4790421 [Trichonephila clavipes]|nr:hypothetical protein TNCV_4790421 [Trichonephila clavipes]
MLRSPSVKEPTKKPSRKWSRLNRKSPLTLRGAKSIIITHIDKYTAMTEKRRGSGKPLGTLDSVDRSRSHWIEPRLLLAFA